MEFKKFLAYSNLTFNQYQYDGVKWLAKREKDILCKGGIIADEMGLGKTIMMIGNILNNFSRSTLIVLPVVLIEQWKEQFIRTTGHVPLIYHGKNIKKSAATLRDVPIVLTTYGTLVADFKREKKLVSINWNRVIFDEAHHLRNRKTKIAKVACIIKSEVKWLITGTPIQNRISDLYSLFEVLKIDKSKFVNMAALRELVSIIILKRTKKQVGIKLPILKETRIEVNWSNNQERKLTEDVHNNIAIDNKMRLAMMLYARMLCILPYIIVPSIKKIQSLCTNDNDNFNGTDYHSKMDSVLDAIISRKGNGNRKIVFSSFHGEIDYIKRTLCDEGLIVEYIDGRVSRQKRKEILDTSSVIDVLIIQINTGSEGLNLQSYNEIYFVTPAWNPYIEKQAIARCHRIGQTKIVEVFRFVMCPCDDETTGSNIEMHTEKIQEKKIEYENTLYM
jgi:SNF2 family DNA or RNA helicase